MSGLIARLRSEPAVVIGILFAAALAAVQSLAGNGIVETDIATTIGNALDPQSGWALPVVAGLITRFFVSPAAKVGV